MGEHEAVAALAAQVAELRELVDSVRATVKARLEQEVGAGLVLRAEVKRLREELAGLSATLSEALDSGKLSVPHAPRWDGLDSADETAQLAALQAWVADFLTVQYPGYRLADCWPAHSEARWELGALHAEWQRINADPHGTDLAGALWFHERWLPGVLARLARSIRCDEAGCQLHPGRG